MRIILISFLLNLIWGIAFGQNNQTGSKLIDSLIYTTYRSQTGEVYDVFYKTFIHQKNKKEVLHSSKFWHERRLKAKTIYIYDAQGRILQEEQINLEEDKLDIKKQSYDPISGLLASESETQMQNEKLVYEYQAAMTYEDNRLISIVSSSTHNDAKVDLIRDEEGRLIEIANTLTNKGSIEEKVYSKKFEYVQGQVLPHLLVSKHPSFNVNTYYKFDFNKESQIVSFQQYSILPSSEERKIAMNLTYAYNESGLLERIENDLGEETVLAEFHFASNGLIEIYTNKQFKNGELTASRKWEYTYDSTNQMQIADNAFLHQTLPVKIFHKHPSIESIVSEKYLNFGEKDHFVLNKIPSKCTGYEQNLSTSEWMKTFELEIY